MKMMKKVLAIALAGAMALCVLTGCGGGGGGSNAAATETLADALNATGVAKFELAEGSLKQETIQKLQEYTNEELADDEENTISDAVGFAIGDILADEMVGAPEGTIVDEIHAVIENADTMSAKMLADKVLENLQSITVTKKVGGGYRYSLGAAGLDKTETYEITMFTLNTDKGVCTVVLFE